jgi:molybdopterin molybdotransferase
MLSVAEARARILEHFGPLGTESIALAECAGRVLAEPVVAEHDLPPFANSSMDGYAVRSGEVASATAERPVVMPVSGDIPAGGGVPGPLPAGTVARIMTGAPLPAGADAVVPVEDTGQARHEIGAALPAEVRIFIVASPGANVRPAGQDVRAGQVVLEPGAVLRPASVAVLASLGHGRVTVYRRPCVAVLSTGDELREVDEPLAAGQIHDANSYSLAAAAAQYGARVLRLGIARDVAAEVRARLQQAREQAADLILTSAGVSVGAYDVVKAVVEAEGNLAFWRVRMRPGKPLAFGQLWGVPFFGLPGNPVSALLSFEVFVRPAILKAGGHRTWNRLEIKAVLTESMRSDGRESYLRVDVERQGATYVARPAGDQGSAVLSTLVRANGLLIVPEGVREARAGEEFTVWLLDTVETGTTL